MGSTSPFGMSRAAVVNMLASQRLSTPDMKLYDSYDRLLGSLQETEKHTSTVVISY